MAKSKFYLGKLKQPSAFADSTHYTIIESKVEPTEQSYGDLCTYVIGPFKTKRALLWAKQFGFLNPHFQNVDDAERIAKHLQEK